MARTYEPIDAAAFTDAVGADDWRVIGDHAFALFRTGDFATGLRLVDEIGQRAEEADHHPDLVLRYGQLEVRLSTHDTGSLTNADLDLAKEISAAASVLGCSGDADAVDDWQWVPAADPA